MRRFLKAAVLLLGCTVSTVQAQTVDVHTSRESDGRTIVDFDVSWDASLAAFVDSVGLDAWSPGVLDAVTAGAAVASETVELSSLSFPAIRVLRHDFDEIPVPLNDSFRNSGYVREVVWTEGLGMYRRRPVVEVAASILDLDAGSGMLRRTRSIRIEITPSAAGFAVKSGSTPGNPHLEIGTSALASGTLFRISIEESGAYRITRGLLESIGVNPDMTDPDRIHIYTNGGHPVPALNSASRPADVVEQPVLRTGGGDGRFDATDDIVFYGAAPRGWLTADGKPFEHFVHPYSNDNAVFMKIDGVNGLDLVPEPVPGFANAAVYTSSTGRFFIDIEERVWSKEHGSGSDWVSNSVLSGSSRTILSNQTLPGLQAGTVQYESRVAIASNPRATVAFESGAAILGQITAPLITVRGSQFPTAVPAVASFNQQVSAGQPLNVTMRLLAGANEPEAAIDWLRVRYSRDLVASSGTLSLLTRTEQSGPQEYRLGGFTSRPEVWDVTGGRVNGAYTAVARGGAWAVQMEGGPRDLFAFTASGVRSIPAERIRPVENQNLHGIQSYPDLVIVAAALFRDAANRLADHRRDDGLEVVVVTPEEIYNEFSGGLPDMRAVRDYLKFLYDRAPGQDQLLQYALLFGDGHYDFRGLSSFPSQLENHVFPFESDESMFTDGTYTSDDYFGLLDDSEGEWPYSSFTSVSNERVDLGIGRLPAQTTTQAEMLVDKIISYESAATYGAWRSRYTAVADDGPTGLSGSQNDRDLHLANVDQVAELVRNSLFPEINIRKIYAEQYQRVFLNSFRIPEAREDIKAALNDGTLIFNYSGHGGPDGLAQEDIFTKEDAESLTNAEKLAIFITATCSFGWWDLEEFQSGAEAALLNPDGGAIALFTTVRLVYTSSDSTALNAGLNRALNQELFRADAEGLPRRLGDALRETKNTRVGLQGNSRKFNLLGDPSMRIGLPSGRVSVNQLNDTDLAADTGQMKALDRVSLAGNVLLPAGTLDSGFNGTVDVLVYDAVRNVPLVDSYFNPDPFFVVREDLIWRGRAEAVAGRFSAEFVVPKDISYSNQPGRIAAYAHDGSGQAIGYSENFLVGGTSDTPPNDGMGPDIRLFLNDTTFVDGGSVPADPELIVRLFDESGVNTVGAGVGHEMLLVVDADEQSADNIGDAFVADANSFRSGEVRWPLQDLESGPHRLSVRAWDVLNNSNMSEIVFDVATDEVLNVYNVYNYPNPMNRETRFVFEHNQAAGTPARIQVRIFTLNGLPIRTIDSEEALPEGVLGSGPVQIPWDGRDDDLDRPATGVYLYRVRVEIERPDGESQVSEHVDRLAIIR